MYWYHIHDYWVSKLPINSPSYTNCVYVMRLELEFSPPQPNVLPLNYDAPFRSANAQYRWGLWILSEFRELSFCGPCGPCFSFIRFVAECFYLAISSVLFGLVGFTTSFINTTWFTINFYKFSLALTVSFSLPQGVRT